MDESRKQSYLKAYDDWQKHPEGVHAMLLEGRRLSSPQWKASSVVKPAPTNLSTTNVHASRASQMSWIRVVK